LRLIEKGRVAMGKMLFLVTWTYMENIAIKYGLMFGELTNRVEDLMFRLPPIKIDHIKD
jgi:hypothetical protein